jgi:hypothetical protein
MMLLLAEWQDPAIPDEDTPVHEMIIFTTIDLYMTLTLISTSISKFGFLSQSVPQRAA